MSEEASKNQYSADSIQALEGMEHVRMRPSMYIGDVGVRGLHHLVYEVVDNSIDEAMAGGRGIPIGIHKKEGVSALEVVMTKIGAGGKFDKDSYKVSGGLHGVGVSCVNALSNHLRATVYKEGKVWEQEYERGKAMYPVKAIGETDFTGTEVTFLPDPTIFQQTTEYNYDTLASRLRELSYLNKGLTITLEDKRQPKDDGTFEIETFHSEVGLAEFVRFLDGTRNAIIGDVISMEGEKNGIPVEVAMIYNDSYSENLHSYVNNINTHEGGTHLAGFRRGLTGSLKKFAENSGMLDKLKFDIAGDDFREGLTAIISVKVGEPQFEGQTKTKLGNREVTSAVSQAVAEMIEIYMEENPNDAKTIVQKVILAAQARHAAKKAREMVQRKTVMSIGEHKVFENEEIRNIFTALGVTIGTEEDSKELNLSKLRYHKVVIMCDADVDGSHISTLILTFFFRYMRELVENGYVYIATPPLYLVKKGQKKRYAWDDDQRDSIAAEFGRYYNESRV